MNNSIMKCDYALEHVIPLINRLTMDNTDIIASSNLMVLTPCLGTKLMNGWPFTSIPSPRINSSTPCLGDPKTTVTSPFLTRPASSSNASPIGLPSLPVRRRGGPPNQFSNRHYIHGETRIVTGLLGRNHVSPIEPPSSTSFSS